jgi:hypothetical protein
VRQPGKWRGFSSAFLPERSKANGTAVIVCPGGGFRFLEWESEGTDVAEGLRARGVAAFVLKYRLLDTGATKEELRKSLQSLFSPQKGNHGFGMRKQGLPSDGWIDCFSDWLRQQGLLRPTKDGK